MPEKERVGGVESVEVFVFVERFFFEMVFVFLQGLFVCLLVCRVFMLDFRSCFIICCLFKGF